MAQSIEELQEQYSVFSDQVRDIDKVITGSISDDASIGATSESKTANWRLLRLVWVVMSFLQQAVWDLFKIEVQGIAERSPKMNSRWLKDEVLIFQYGDELLFNSETRQYYYEEVDEEKQIIARVAVDDQVGLAIVKVAKTGPAALSVDELAAFKSFVRLIQPTGSNIEVISQPADEIHLPIEIEYDAQIAKAQVMQDVEAAINSYLESLSFNGTFYIITMVDYIQEVEGVIDVIPGDLKAWPSTEVPLVDDPFNRKYKPLSGYLKIYEDSPLDQVITYTPSNG